MLWVALGHWGHQSVFHRLHHDLSRCHRIVGYGGTFVDEEIHRGLEDTVAAEVRER